METFRRNLQTEIKKIGSKIFIEKMNMTKSALSLLMNGKRKFREDHFEDIEKILGKPICNLFQSEEEILKQKREREKMKEYREMIELMEMIPAIRQIILGKKAELEKTFADEIRLVEKKNSMALKSKSD